MGYSYKQLWLNPGKSPSTEVQEAVIEDIEKEVQEALNGLQHVYFLDPTHLIFTTEVACCWQKKGKQHTRKISSNTGRRRLNVLGAVDATTKKPVIVLTEDNCDKYGIEMLLKEIRKEHQDGKEIVIYLDNAPYNHAGYVEEVANDLNIRLEFLPPYSPNLNLIERLWRFLKRKVKYNRYYESYELFEQAVVDLFKNIDDHLDSLHKILALNFQII